MDPRLSIVTLGVHDLAAARRFYVEGLGWTATVDVPGEIVAIQVGHGLLLSLYGREDLADEAGDIYSGSQGAPITLGHVVADEGAVTEVLDQAVAAGGTLLAPAQRRSWGGLSAYFADPDGYRWEVLHNPGLSVAGDGRVMVGPAA